ncbi:hypothetical protein GCM10019016_070240 [Streptomyces prasinosporus]|uniref:Uncharacterized protein n=1 Tax=Streptomyces prasinosporus TaxID=68256 RepID=A0ABP6TXR8_9ACTN
MPAVAMFAMPRTLTAPGNAEDPVVGRRRGLAGTLPYAAVVAPADELEPELELEPESEEDDDEEELDGFDDAGELLDEEPRLSLR